MSIRKERASFITFDDITGLPIIDGEHRCEDFGCHHHAEDYADDVLYDGDDIVGMRD